MILLFTTIRTSTLNLYIYLHQDQIVISVSEKSDIQIIFKNPQLLG